MIGTLILCFAGLFCVAGVILFTCLALKYRDEEFVPVFVIAGGICIALAAASVVEAVKRADAYERIVVPDR